MPINVSVDHDADMTIMKATGRLFLEEIKQVVIEFYDGQPTRKVIWDIDSASVAHFQVIDIKNLLQVIRKRFSKRPNGKTAVVTKKDSDFGMIRMLEAYAHEAPVELRVFRSLESAEIWLNGA